MVSIHRSSEQVISVSLVDHLALTPVLCNERGYPSHEPACMNHTPVALAGLVDGSHPSAVCDQILGAICASYACFINVI